MEPYECYPACYFLTGDNTIELGDSVLIPIGTHGIPVNGMVINCLHIYPKNIDIDILTFPSIQEKSADSEIFLAYDLLRIKEYPFMKSSLMHSNLYDEELAAYYTPYIIAIEFLNGFNEAQKVHIRFKGSIERIELKGLDAARIFHKFAVEGQREQKIILDDTEQIGCQFYKEFLIFISQIFHLCRKSFLPCDSFSSQSAPIRALPV